MATLDRDRRRRQRKRRLVYSFALILMVAGFVWFLQQRSTTTIMIVTHAEVESGVENPGLSPAGRIRANELFRVLGDVAVTDGFDAIFATRWRRTQETAEPLSYSINNPLQIINATEPGKVYELLQEDYKGKVVLLVVDPADVKALLAKFEGRDGLKAIANGQHDTIYIVSVPWFGKEKTLQIHYGSPYTGQQPDAIE